MPEISKIERNLFISYSRADAWIMRAIRAELSRAGIPTWVDENVPSNAPSWIKILQSEIEKSAGLIVILSPNAKDSEWVDRELGYASTHNKSIFVVLAEGDAKSSVPISIINNQRFELKPNYSHAIFKLVQGIRKELGLQVQTDSELRVDRTGSILWLLNDYLFARKSLDTSNSIDIIKGLTQFHHHSKRLNLGKEIVEPLAELKATAKRLPEKSLTMELRYKLIQDMDKIWNAARDLIISQDPDWQPNPEE